MNLHHLRIGSIKVKSPSDWVSQVDVTFRLGQSRWRHLQIRSIKVTSPSDWVNQGDITFRLNQSRWCHLPIFLPFPLVVSFLGLPSLGQLRWHHLQIGSIKVTSPSDWVNQGDITFRLNQSRWCHLPIFLPYPWSFLSLAFLPSFSWPSFLPSLIGLVWLNTLCIIRCYWQKALKTTLCECREYFVKAPMA